MKEYIGDPEIEYVKLMQISPLFRARQLIVPLFIAHGEKDENVDIEQASRFIRILKNYSKQFEVHIDKEANHSFSGNGQMSNLLEKVKTFVDTHI